MQSILDKLAEWLKELLISGILGNLSGMFDTVNTKVDEIAGEVGMTPSAWNGGDGHAHLFILCAGLYNADYSDKKDGGIVAIDTADHACETGFLVSEAYLDEAISDFDFSNGSFYVAANSTSASDLWKVTPSDSAKTKISSIASAYTIPCIQMSSTGLLLVADRTSSAPGIRILDTAHDTFTSDSVIPTDLPPYDIAISE